MLECLFLAFPLAAATTRYGTSSSPNIRYQHSTSIHIIRMVITARVPSAAFTQPADRSG